MSLLNNFELSSKNDKNIVTESDVASVISNRCGIPVYEIVSDSLKDIDSIKDKLLNTIIGQESVINYLMDITKRIRYGYNDKCYSILFVGPSGVGKSILAKEYAKVLVGEDNFIRLDMSEYSDSTSINKILGSSPGYVGYDDNKNILEEIRNKPNSVLLLDEIDKAHPSVINLFYQILEEGKIKNSKGRIVRFNNVIIIMTSNIGFEKSSIGFNKISNNNIYSSLKNYFSTAFINRLDNVLIFNRLDRNNIITIIDKRLKEVRNRYSDINIKLSDNISNEIMNKCNFFDFGARRIDKIISKDIENIIIDSVINGKKEVVINSICEEKNITIK